MVQLLNVVPHGLIQSGQVKLTMDPITGLIDLSDSIVAGWAFFTETIADSEELSIDPSMLLSANIQKGLYLKVGPLGITVQDVMNSIAQLGFVCADTTDYQGVSGTATLDLSGHYWVLTHVLANGTVKGSSVELELKE